MADKLVIHESVLETALTAISSARGDFNNAGNVSDSVANSVGHRRLHDVLVNFSKSWSIHREKLGGSLETLESQLRGAKDAFDKADHAIAEGVGPHGSKPPTPKATEQEPTARGPANPRGAGHVTGHDPSPPAKPDVHAAPSGSSSGTPAPSAIDHPSTNPGAEVPSTPAGTSPADPGSGPPGIVPDATAATAAASVAAREMLENADNPAYAGYLTWLKNTFNSVGPDGLAAAGVGVLGVAVLAAMGLLSGSGSGGGAGSAGGRSNAPGGTWQSINSTVDPSRSGSAPGGATPGLTGVPDGNRAPLDDPSSGLPRASESADEVSGSAATPVIADAAAAVDDSAQGFSAEVSTPPAASESGGSTAPITNGAGPAAANGGSALPPLPPLPAFDDDPGFGAAPMPDSGQRDVAPPASGLPPVPPGIEAPSVATSNAVTLPPPEPLAGFESSQATAPSESTLPPPAAENSDDSSSQRSATGMPMGAALGAGMASASSTTTNSRGSAGGAAANEPASTLPPPSSTRDDPPTDDPRESRESSRTAAAQAEGASR